MEKVDTQELAEKYQLTTEEVDDLLKAFKAGNKKGKAVKLPKFKLIIAEVEKLHPKNENFSPSVAEYVKEKRLFVFFNPYLFSFC